MTAPRFQRTILTVIDLGQLRIDLIIAEDNGDRDLADRLRAVLRRERHAQYKPRLVIPWPRDDKRCG